MSDLLKESIADAKAVRETAIANAKTFLEENFAKSMKEMFAEKLKEESEEQDGGEEEGKIEEKLASSGIGKDDSNIASKQHPTQPSTSAKKNTTPAGKQEFDATLEEGEEITSEELDEILAELEQDGHKENGEMEEKHDVVAEEEEASGEEEEIVDLDELLAELEEDGQAPAAPAAPAAAVVDPTTGLPVAPAAPVAAAPVAPAPGQVPSPMEEDTYEEDVTAEEMAEALVAINEENEALKNSLKEHQNTVKYLKGVLEETNLLNAKLLYTNKIFKGKNLTEDQKLKVINTFDLTKTLREIKLAYTVLAESINAGGSVAKKKSNATVSTITEGLASKPVSSTKPDSTIVEPQADVMASRFQKLAGIKK
jgi:hypothetical protein|tara:strand:+ start:4733 stop:5836 length:1104 start_codon:yes stop_codon:yes gene_type:complete